MSALCHQFIPFSLNIHCIAAPYTFLYHHKSTKAILWMVSPKEGCVQLQLLSTPSPLHPPRTEADALGCIPRAPSTRQTLLGF